MIKKKNKKAAGGLNLKKIVTLLVIGLVIVLVILSIFKWDIPGRLGDVFPNLQRGGEAPIEVIQEQTEISEADRKICPSPECNNYPTIFSRYFEAYDDDFWIRWNSNINRPQIVMEINFRKSFWKSNKQSEEWLINPISDTQFRSSDLDALEMQNVKWIMKSSSYKEMLERILSTGWKVHAAKKVDSNKLKVKLGFGFSRTSASGAEELNTYLRKAEPESFEFSDELRLERAKIEIEKIYNALESFTGETYLLISGMDGWYFYGNYVDEDNEKWACLCNNKDCSDLKECKQPKFFVGFSRFLNENYSEKLKF